MCIKAGATMRDTKAIINLKALEKNIFTTRALISKKTKLAAVVKANAYGHGIFEVSGAALAAGADMLAVALASEGVVLREKGINAPIFILGSTSLEDISIAIEKELIITAFNEDQFLLINENAQKLNKKAKVAFALDTGMHRIGATESEFEKILDSIKNLKNIDIEIIFSHFASAGGPLLDYAIKQNSEFEKVLSKIKKACFKQPLLSMSASGAIFTMPDAHYDIVRLGISMYGLYPSNFVAQTHKLYPALSLVTKISHIQKLPKDSYVGYEMTHKTTCDTYIATLSIGYGDGYDRALSNKGYVLIEGEKKPIVGNICMDQMMVDLGENTNAKVGDEVVLIGSQGNETITLEEIAKLSETITHELACRIAERVPRIYVRKEV